MKSLKFLLIVALGSFALSAASTGEAQAAPYGMAGCGIGSIAFGDQEGMIQVIAATLNGTVASQTFGITSGTSNCVSRGVVRQDSEQEAFFEMNYAELREDMATGQGEHLLAMGTLLGCSADMQPALASFSQEHYEQVFPTAETTPNQALYSYKMQLSQQEEFAQSCARL